MLRRQYGLTLEQYQAMLAAQDGVCWICGADPSTCRYEALVVDHDHKTGKVRGLLCNACNSGLGYFRDSISNLEAAMDYLERAGR